MNKFNSAFVKVIFSRIKQLNNRTLLEFGIQHAIARAVLYLVKKAICGYFFVRFFNGMIKN